MKPLSKTKQIENVILAAMLWHEVKPRKVQLDTWSCGTQACFGGWLASWPEFAAQGVGRAGRFTAEGGEPAFCGFDKLPGAPCMIDSNGDAVREYDVAKHLFGDGSLFNIRHHHTSLNGGVNPFEREGRKSPDDTFFPPYKVSDHELVAIRLENQFVELTK